MDEREARYLAAEAMWTLRHRFGWSDLHLLGLLLSARSLPDAPYKPTRRNPDGTPAMIERKPIVADTSGSTSKTKAQLVEEVEALQARLAEHESKDGGEVAVKPVSAKLFAIQTAVQEVAKTGYHNHANYSYFEEHGVIELLRPLLRRERAAVVVSCGESVTVITDGIVFGRNKTPSALTTLTGEVRFMCADTGDEICATYVGQAIDSEGKGAGKAQTYLTKYALQKFFLIPTQHIEDSDHDVQEAQSTEASAAPAPAQAQGSAPPPAQATDERVSKQKADALVAAITLAVTNGQLDGNKVKAQLARYRTDDVAALTVGQYGEFTAWLDAETTKQPA